MAQSSLPRGRTWSGSSTGVCSGSSRSVKNERYLELKQLELEARKASTEMKNIEIEIRDLSAIFEKLKNEDAQRTQRLGELLAKDQAPKDVPSSENADGVGEKENGDAKVERSDTEQIQGDDLQEQLTSLKHEQESAQRHLLSTKANLEQKRTELEILTGEYKTLTEQIAKEGKDLQTLEMEESLQQRAAVQHEMRSLSEDIGRLGRMMEEMKETSSADQLKQNLRRAQKPRVYHPVTSIRSRKLAKNLQNGVASDLGRVTDPPSGKLKEPTRIKEPGEFEEREAVGSGENRKRQKSSSAELERERLHEQRSKLEMEAKEKHILLEYFGAPPSEPEARKGVSSRRKVVSPSAVFGGSEESPPLVPVRSGSTGSTSVSSEVSSEFSLEKVDKGFFSAAAKRLDFESPKDARTGCGIVALPEDTGSSSRSRGTSIGTDYEYKEEIARDNYAEVQVEEIQSLDIFSRKVSEEVLLTDDGTEEIHRLVKEAERFRQGEIGEDSKEDALTTGKGTDEIGKISEAESYSLVEAAEEPTGEEVEVIDRPTEEFNIFGDAEEARDDEALTPGNVVDEIDLPWEEVDSFGDPETRGDTMEMQILTSESGSHELNRPTDTTIRSGYVGSAEVVTEVGSLSDAQGQQLSQSHQNSLGSAWAGVPDKIEEAELLQAEETKAPFKGDWNISRDWSLETDKQITQLGSHLSSLPKQVEDGVDLHEKKKSNWQPELASAEKEQLSKQVAFFSDEVTGLRQNFDEIERNLHKEAGGRSVVELWAKDLQSKCADQSAQLEHLGKKVGLLDKELKYHLQLRVDIESKLEKEAQERLKVEAQLTDLSKVLALTVSSIEKEEEAVGELVEQQKHLIVDQLKEARKLRNIAEVRVLTLNKQIENLELVCDVAQNIQVAAKYQDKALKYGLQTLVQLFMLAIGVITLYSRVAEPFRGSLVPT